MSKTPKLRFKEFSGDWESDRLSKVCDINPKTSQIPDEFYYIDLESVVKGELIKENIITKSEAPSRAQRVLSQGDTLFQTVRPYQNNNYYFSKERDLSTVASTGYAQLRSYTNSEFLYHLIYTSRFGKNVLLRCTGSNYPAINTTDLSEIEIYYPSKEEQDKIASFLSLIDDKISLQGEKLELLKDYKSGMMQKIFSMELRFKDDEGRDYPEWEEKKLNQLGDTYTGLSGKTKENFGIGECKYVIYKNVFGNTIAKEDEVELVEINEGESQNKVIKGDLLFTTSSETPEEVGMVSCWNYDVEDLYLNSFCFGYRLFDLEQYSPIFIAYLLRSESYRRKISILGQGSTRYNISKNELMKMKIKVPVIEEQRKIVSLLLGIESKIEKEQEKLDSLNEYKKGLLQQMFV